MQSPLTFPLLLTFSTLSHSKSPKHVKWYQLNIHRGIKKQYELRVNILFLLHYVLAVNTGLM